MHAYRYVTYIFSRMFQPHDYLGLYKPELIKSIHHRLLEIYEICPFENAREADLRGDMEV